MTYLYIALGVLAVVIIIWFIAVSNKLNKTIVKIEEADSGIDVALTKRYDVLTKMMDVVKSYAKHEEETLIKVIEMRKGMSIEEKEKASKSIDEGLKQISIVAENYPELRSNENYNTLQSAIADTEEHLQAARRAYNSNISSLNQMIVTFPTNIVAGMKHVTKKEFFQAEANKKEDVKIEL